MAISEQLRKNIKQHKAKNIQSKGDEKKVLLDFYMKERRELPEDDQCPLMRLIVIGKHKKRIKGVLSPTMRGLSNFIWDRNKSSDKTAK